MTVMISRPFMRKKSLRLVLSGLALAGFFRIIVSPAGADEGLTPAITEFSADQSAVQQAFQIPCAESTLDRQEVLLKAWQARLENLPYEPLTPTARIDWHLLRNYLTSEQSGLKLERARLTEMEPLLAFRRPLQALLAARMAQNDVRRTANRSG